MAILEHPAPGTYSLAGFGPRAPINTPAGPSSSFHRGRDYSLHGRTFRVLAARAGRVRWAYRSTMGGNEALIEHDVPGLGYLATRYGHLASFAPDIRAGAWVNTGQLLGMAGATGRADGVHLHLEVFRTPALGMAQVDPDQYLSTDTKDDDDMALTETQARGLEWLGRSAEALDIARFQTGDLWARRGVLDALALDGADVDESADAEAIAVAVVAKLGGSTAEHLAAAILDAVRALPAQGGGA